MLVHDRLSVTTAWLISAVSNILANLFVLLPTCISRASTPCTLAQIMLRAPCHVTNVPGVHPLLSCQLNAPMALAREIMVHN